MRCVPRARISTKILCFPQIFEIPESCLGEFPFWMGRSQMNLHYQIPPAPPRQPFHHPSYTTIRFNSTPNDFLSSIISTDRFSYGVSYPQLKPQKSATWKFLQAKRKQVIAMRLRDEIEPVTISKKKGSISGAVALIVGTSIGSGILALPKKVSPAGLLPSSISMTMCWAFMLIEALLLVEINVNLLRKKEMGVIDDELEIVSITTMAQETLGEWGRAFATVISVFLGYTSIVAYSAKSGEILQHLIGSPELISEVLFTTLFTVLICVGDTQATGQVNQWLTVCMIGLLIAIEIFAVMSGGWSGFEGQVAAWENVPATLPVMIFTLAYHDLAPVLCTYLEGDLTRIRTSVILGSIVPLLAYLVWDAIALGFSNQADQVSDPVELLLSVRWEAFPFMIEAFSLLAIGTSLIGTLLAFSKFLKEQLSILSSDSPATKLDKSDSSHDIRRWWQEKKASVTVIGMVLVPSLLLSTTVPDAFSAATDIAGGYCMAMLYGVLPPAMAWAMMYKEKEQETEQSGISMTRPVVVGVGILACGVVAEQIFQDFSFMHLLL